MTTKLGDWIQQQSSQKRLYILRNQIGIWAKGKRVQRMKAWLTDWGFLEQKLGAVGITALIDDYDLLLPLLPAEEQPGLKRIQGALQLSAHVLVEDNSQLAGQLLGRLLSFSDPEILALLQQAKQGPGKLWFRPLTAHLTPPGGPLLRTLTGHSSEVNAVAITPDGKQAVSASYDNTLKLWDLATGSELATLSGHSSLVLAVAITPDGKQAVSASWNNTLKLWDLATGSELATLTGHSSSVEAVAITPDGKQAVSASRDNTLKLWDLATGSELATLTGHRDWVRAVAITPDGKQAVSASWDKTLKLWDLATRKQLATLTGHSNSVEAVAITPDGKQAVSASDDKTLKLWDLATRKQLATLTGYSNSVNAVAITPDSKQAVSASWDYTLKLWDLATGEVLATSIGDGGMLSCGMASDGVTVVAGDNSGRVYFLRLEGLESEAQC